MEAIDVQFITVDNLKIAYIEKNAKARHTIFFVPGNSVSKKVWRKQFDSDALLPYRLIGIDLPASGDSDSYVEKNYSIPLLAEILYKAVTKLANGKPYIIAGISLGTNIVAEMTTFNINPSGLILAGPCIAGKGFGLEQFVKPDTHVGIAFQDEPSDEKINAYARETSFSGEEDIRLFIEDFKAIVSPFRSSLGNSIANKNYQDEIRLLIQKNIPLLIIFGKDEAIINCDYLDNASLPLWNKKIYKLKNASHLVNVDQPAEFNELMKKFADDIFLK